MPDRDEALKALQELSDEELREIVDELVRDPRVRRREGWRGWWYRYAGSVAFVTLILIGAAGFFRIESVAEDAHDAATSANQTAAEVEAFTIRLREAQVESCERNNDTRRALIGSLRKQNHDSRQTDPSLFPDIPPDRFQELVQQQIKTNQETIKTLQPVDCEAAYPKGP